jgi:hypothetical protein
MSKEKKKLPSINIKGKEYVTVAQRVLAFNELYPNGMIETELQYIDAIGIVRAKSTVIPDTDKPLRFFVGHSEEDRASSNINRTSATENAETSAVGRALGLMGIGVIEGIASVDEIVKAENKQKQPEDSLAKKAYKAIDDAKTIEALTEILIKLESAQIDAPSKSTLVAITKAKIDAIKKKNDDARKMLDGQAEQHASQALGISTNELNS